MVSVCVSSCGFFLWRLHNHILVSNNMFILLKCIHSLYLSMSNKMNITNFLDPLFSLVLKRYVKKPQIYQYIPNTVSIVFMRARIRSWSYFDPNKKKIPTAANINSIETKQTNIQPLDKSKPWFLLIRLVHRVLKKYLVYSFSLIQGAEDI